MGNESFEFNAFKSRLKLILWSILRIPFKTLFGIPTTLVRHLNRSLPIELIDVGAHNGSFTAGMGYMVPLSRALLIEPQPEKAIRLRGLFGGPKYHVAECALSSCSGTADFRINRADATSSLFSFRNDLADLKALDISTAKVVRCETRTLDEVSEIAGFQKADLIKIDVQGAECLVLTGAKRILANTSKVWVEVSFRPLYEGSCTFFDVYALLVENGFKLVEMEPGFRSSSGELLQADALFVHI